YENIQKLMMDLDPNNNYIILDFSHKIPINKAKDLNRLISDTLDNFSKFDSFMKNQMNQFFELQIHSLGYSSKTKELTREKSEPIEMKDINKIIKVRGINANREVSNKENNHSLSKTSNLFYRLNNGNTLNDEANNILQETIVKVDNLLTNAYCGDENNRGIFTSVFNRVKKFGGIDSSSELSIRSTISERDLLSNNTTLFYKQEDSLLPETYNGLGYLNLYGMIFEIETIMVDIKKDHANINLIYIEEPESHTHPQLQYIFIKNIKDLIKEHFYELNQNNTKELQEIQSIITTHSSHIVSDCNFDDLIYFKREQESVISKSFNSLGDEYKSDKLGYRFVKQYLTLSNSELFFSDKVICIEGDTERILLARMMQKIDREYPITSERSITPLLSQNISIIETGAYSHVFKKLFDFLGIKVLIITDIDTTKKEEKVDKNGNIYTVYTSCIPEEGTHISNHSILEFFGKDNFLKDATQTQFSLISNKTAEEKCIGNFRIAYQIPESESGYQPASFEDAFISLNKKFIADNKINLIKYGAIKRFSDTELNDFYVFARSKIDKKSTFASSLLYFENENNTWKVPKYILEGLLWLKEQ
ncbi:TPA: AAA family ATPase, partial [Mannheimia haemolytica]